MWGYLSSLHFSLHGIYRPKPIRDKFMSFAKNHVKSITMVEGVGHMVSNPLYCALIELCVEFQLTFASLIRSRFFTSVGARRSHKVQCIAFKRPPINPLHVGRTRTGTGKTMKPRTSQKNKVLEHWKVYSTIFSLLWHVARYWLVWGCWK